MARVFIIENSSSQSGDLAIEPVPSIFFCCSFYQFIFVCTKCYFYFLFFFVCVLYLLLLIGSEPQRVINIFLAQHFRGFIRPELVALWQLCLEISVIYDAFLGGMPLFTISDFIMEEDERNCFCSE